MARPMTDPRDARIAEQHAQQINLARGLSARADKAEADLTAARAEIERLSSELAEYGGAIAQWKQDAKDAWAEVDTLRAQVDTAREGLVAAHDCLARAMMRVREAPSGIAEWAAIHSELFCGVRDADQVLPPLLAQPGPDKTPPKLTAKDLKQCAKIGETAEELAASLRVMLSRYSRDDLVRFYGPETGQELYEAMIFMAPASKVIAMAAADILADYKKRRR